MPSVSNLAVQLTDLDLPIDLDDLTGRLRDATSNATAQALTATRRARRRADKARKQAADQAKKTRKQAAEQAGKTRRQAAQAGKQATKAGKRAARSAAAAGHQAAQTGQHAAQRAGALPAVAPRRRVRRKMAWPVIALAAGVGICLVVRSRRSTTAEAARDEASGAYARN